MKGDVLSARQMMVLLFVALLVPVVDILPSVSAQLAGGGGWLLPLIVFVPLLAAFWASGGIWNGEKTVLHYIIYIMYMFLIFLLLVLSLRLCALRLEGIYQKSPAVLASIAFLAVSLWMCRGKCASLARAGEIFYLAVAVILAGVILLGIFQVDLNNLSISKAEGVKIPKGALAAAGILLNVYPAGVIGRKVTSHKNNRRRVFAWTAAFCLTAALLLGVIIGNLGPTLTAQLPSPFLIMVQGLGVKGAFQRMEALVSALWVLCDFVLVGLLLHGWRGLADEIHPGKWGSQSMYPMAAAALLVGWLLLKGRESVIGFCINVLPVTGLVFGLVFPLIFKLFFKLRSGKKIP